ncbi:MULTISPECIES: HdeD family acid-resistance protein [unclassified Dinoroseobacter]|uniref:HdeD family acid-resistance protein n=1 Tax=unclassified Dinoroseobacter TaxID=2620028 RepID=UPI003C799AF6
MKDWMKWVLLGLLSLICGIIVLGNTVLASVAVTAVTGALFLFAGAAQIAGGLQAESMGSKLFSIGMGALAAFLGISFLFHPLEGAISLALLITILLAVSGGARIVFAWTMKQTQFFWPMLISGALSILLAGYILANFATASAQLLGVLLGVELLFNGLGFTVLGFFLRAHPELAKTPKE